MSSNDGKRRSGQTIKVDEVLKWLVLTESKGKVGEGFTHKCGTVIQGASVAHPIHDGPFPLTGSGQVYNETVPFCPECEFEPNYHGAPVDHDPNDRRDMEILHKIASGK